MTRKRRNSNPSSGRSRRIEVCKKCKKPGRVGARDKKGRPTCKKCCDLAYYHNPANHERCIDCGVIKPVARRRNGWALCRSCARKDVTFHEVCFYCDTLKPVSRYNTFDKPVCQNCSIKGLGGPSIYADHHNLRIRGITPTKEVFRRFESMLQVAQIA